MCLLEINPHHISFLKLIDPLGIVTLSHVKTALNQDVVLFQKFSQFNKNLSNNHFKGNLDLNIA